MKIGIVGAGMIGSTMATLWVKAGHDVRIASRHPEALKPMVEALGSRASSGTPSDAAAFGDVVMLTVPLHATPGLARDLAPLLAGKVVIDTGNAYEKRDGESVQQVGSTRRQVLREPQVTLPDVVLRYGPQVLVPQGVSDGGHPSHQP